MNSQVYMDVATLVTRLRMYPYFDIANYIILCIAVREDVLQQTAGPDSSSQAFSRRHPLSSWLSSVLICFSGSIIANFLLGEPVITPFKDHRNLATATAVWYLVNYSPFDLVYKLCKFLPFHLTISIMKEIQRAHTIYHGVLVTKKLLPNAYLIIVLVGTIKGSGCGLMKNIDRLVRGIWVSGSNEIMQPSFSTKASVVASIIFLCERLKLIAVPHPLVYFGVVMFFVYFKISSLLLGIHDPFVPFENLFCAIFMGELLESLHKATVRGSAKEDDSKDSKNDVIKSVEAKKID